MPNHVKNVYKQGKIVGGAQIQYIRLFASILIIECYY
jgi:hypothetical protein